MKRLTQESGYFIRIGSELLNKAVIPDSYFQTTIRKFQASLDFQVSIHCMFDESNTIDGARISVGLLKNQTNLENASQCRIRIYKVSNDATPWNLTLVKTATPAIDSNKRFITTLTSTELGEDIFGDVTFQIHARVLRKHKPYYGIEYFNHIGLTDKVERLRRKVNFMNASHRKPGENYF